MKKRLLLIGSALLLLLLSVSAAASYINIGEYSFLLWGYDEASDNEDWPLTKPDRDYASKNYTVLNHVVYQRSDSLGLKGARYYIVVDYFDTDKAQAQATNIQIKSKIGGVPVKQISVFYRDSKKHTPIMNEEDCLPQIQSVSIPDCIEVISDYSLSYFASLKTLRLPESLRILGLGACYGMDSLEKITLPKTVESIGEYAFAQCKKLKKVTFSGTALQTIGARAFNDCVSLQKLTLPSSLIGMGDHALLGCTSLSKLNIQTTSVSVLCGENDPLGYDLPRNCKVVVKSKEMKRHIQQDGFKGTVKIQVSVLAPKKLKAIQKNGKLTLKWSKVRNADGYRIYKCSAKGEMLTPLKTVRDKETIILEGSRANSTRYAVKAFRVIDGDISWSVATYITANKNVTC